MKKTSRKEETLKRVEGVPYEIYYKRNEKHSNLVDIYDSEKSKIARIKKEELSTLKNACSESEIIELIGMALDIASKDPNDIRKWIHESNGETMKERGIKEVLGMKEAIEELKAITNYYRIDDVHISLL